MYKLHRSAPDIDGIGQHTVCVQVREYNDAGELVGIGKKEKFGISSVELQSRFGGDEEKWLTKVGTDMLRIYKARKAIQSRLLSINDTEKEIVE